MDMEGVQDQKTENCFAALQQSIAVLGKGNFVFK